MPDDETNAMDDDPTRDTPFPAPARLGAAEPRRPETTGAWLHVVSGPSIPTLSRAVFELCARFLARGERVLVLDGAPRLRLHERFDREAHWGLVECLAGMPVLGLVQDSGRLGLYLLAHGTPGGPVDWSRLAAVVEDARPHFGRAVMAIDPDAPAAIGQVFAGVHLEAWWPSGGNEARRASGIGGRLGIQFSDLDLDSMLTPRLEALEARVWSLAAPAPPVEAEVEVEAEPAASAGGAGSDPVPAGEPVSLEGEPEVAERLRFLLWTRRVRGEGTGNPGTVAAASTPPDESGAP